MSSSVADKAQKNAVKKISAHCHAAAAGEISVAATARFNGESAVKAQAIVGFAGAVRRRDETALYQAVSTTPALFSYGPV